MTLEEMMSVFCTEIFYSSRGMYEKVQKLRISDISC